MTPAVNSGVTIAEAIAKIFARFGASPRIVVNPNAGPSWNPKTNVVSLPALPTHNLSEEEQAQLRAYFWHEAQGEQGNNTWHNRPEVNASKQVKRLSNGIGDGYLDQLILSDRPGAGADIRQQVAADFAELAQRGKTVTPSVGLISSVARYVIERVATWAEIRAAFPQCHELFDHAEPVIPDGITVKDGDDVVRLAMALDAALDQYKNGGDDTPDQDGPESDLGRGQSKKKDKAPKEQKQKPKRDDDSEADDSEADSEDSDDDADGDSDADNVGDGDGSGSGGGDSQTSGNSDDDDAGSSGASSGGMQQNAPDRPHKLQQPRALADGDDSEDRMNKALADALTGGGGKPGLQARTFNEDFRTVITGKELDKSKSGTTYTPNPEVKQIAGALANRLRAALVGPTMKIERNQEYGRFDARRAAAGLAGSRTVYNRRRELQGENVAVSVAWDESGSMGGGSIAAVRRIVECFGLALQQLPMVTAEFTGWTDGFAGGSSSSASTYQKFVAFLGAGGKNAHNAGGGVVHRIYKAFDESPLALGSRLPLIGARDGTPMVEGFGFSAKRLAARTERRKVLFFLTDGQASGDDVDTDTPWGYNALKYEVDRAAASGIDVIVVSIGTALGKPQIDDLNAARSGTGKWAKTPETARRNHVKMYDDIQSGIGQWGENARLMHVDRSNFMQVILNDLTRTLTRKARSL